MSIILHNALLVDIDPVNVESGGIRIDGGRIVERDTSLAPGAGDESIDCCGAVVLPGLVNGHAHLYSALAAGMPAPPKQPTNFHEVLKYVWWRLDRALDAESIEMSSQIGALDALRCGTTTLIDHHASPDHIIGSLDLIERGIDQVGLRGVLCYETTDRNGHEGCEQGLEENRRYLHLCKSRKDARFAGMVGAHASFTVDDDTLDALADQAESTNTGVHIHVAEDPYDEDACRREHGQSLIDRLANHGLLKPQSIFVHGTHLDAEAIARASDAGVTLAHNPRSNMNNAVGYTPVDQYRCPVILGTDGIGSDMFTELEYAWFKSRDGHSTLTPGDCVAMLAGSARRAAAALGVTLGKLAVGAEADVVITDYQPATPLTTDNFAGHFIFCMGPQHVKDVIADGRWALRDRRVVTCDESQIRQSAVRIAQALWDRMAKID